LPGGRNEKEEAETPTLSSGKKSWRNGAEGGSCPAISLPHPCLSTIHYHCTRTVATVPPALVLG